ncbi:MAG: hypothetical protein ACYTBJ_02350 [Planctomycetota bacterium]
MAALDANATLAQRQRHDERGAEVSDWKWENLDDTSKSLAHVGRGQIAINVVIPGVGWYQSYSYTPTDAAFTTGWNSETGYLYDLLEWESIPQYNEQASWLEADLKVSAISIKIADIAGSMTGQLKSWKTRANTKLTVNATSTATAFSTLGTSDFAAGPGLLWIGQECCKYTTVTSTGFTGLTRGYLGTLQQPYDVIDTDEPPTRPIITDGVQGLYKRSVYVRIAVIDPGTNQPGPSTIVYRGRIKKGSKAGKGKYELSVEHKTAVFGDKVGQDMPSTDITVDFDNNLGQAWYSGLTLEESGGISGNTFQIVSLSTTVLFDYDIIPDAGAYVCDSYVPAPYQSLPEEWGAKSHAAAAGLMGDGTPSVGMSAGKATLYADAVAGGSVDWRMVIRVRRGDPLWAMGFEAGTYSSEPAGSLEIKAQSEPRRLTVDYSNAASERPQFDVANSDVLTSGLRAQIPGNYAFKITDITKTRGGLRHTLTIDPFDGDYWGSTRVGAKRFFYVEDREQAFVRHCIVLGKAGALFSETDITNALKIMLGVARDETGVDEPRSWFPQDVRREDFDWDELDTAVSSVPAALRVWYDVIIGGIEVWKALGGWFALFGICPRLTTDGKIGFKRMTDLLSLDAETTAFDGDIWEGPNAAQVMGRLAHGPLVNQVKIRHSYDYRFEDGEPVDALGADGASEWGTPIKIKNGSGIAELAGVKSVKYELRGWFPGTSGMHLLEAAREIQLQIRATHFSLYGLESGVTTIPTTWVGKQFKVGDTVLATHEVVPNTADGEIGLTSKPVKIEGARRSITKDRPDEITVRYGATTQIAGIAPCARGTSYVQGNTQVVFSDAAVPIYEQSGKNDLDRFTSASDLNVLFIEYDVAAPTTWNGTIQGGSATTSTVTLTTDVFSTAFPATGVWMVYADWDSASAAQQDYAYVADTGSPPSLGANNDAAKEWSL